MQKIIFEYKWESLNLCILILKSHNIFAVVDWYQYIHKMGTRVFPRNSFKVFVQLQYSYVSYE